MKYIDEHKIFEIPLETLHGRTENLSLLEEASRALGEVNNFASGAIEYDYVVEALRNIESLTSARIEGTTGNLQDLYAEESLSDERKRQLKLFSAINYKTAMTEISGIVQQYKIMSLPLIRHVHSILTENDPATHGTPGQLRAHDVLISNSQLGDFYPSHPLKVAEHLERMVADYHVRATLPRLFNAAVTHYQFEAIHPFADGNGRTGRMIIVVGLLMDGVIDFPVLNLSQYFERNRDEYIRALRCVSDKSSYDDWVAFFLRGVKEQSLHNLELIAHLRNIEDQDLLTIHSGLRSAAAPLIIKHALNKLFVTVDSCADYLIAKKLVSSHPYQVARTNVLRMVRLGILEPVAFKRGRQNVFVHRKMIDFLKRK